MRQAKLAYTSWTIHIKNVFDAQKTSYQQTRAKTFEIGSEGEFIDEFISNAGSGSA